jgi:2,3-bisphosphoglycerate-independent phosphoglycerate mutase
LSRVLMIFLDGVGLGPNDPVSNPMAVAKMPTVEHMLDGRRLVAGSAPFHGPLASLSSIDARMDVPNTPQSATGQGALVTGRNVPAIVGEHYGPKPNPAVADVIRQGNLFQTIAKRGGSAALLNAYPPQYFSAIESGRRLYSAIPLAATSAGLPLMTAEDLQAGRALSADFTGAGWAAQPGFPPCPVYTEDEAGHKLAELSARYDLAWVDSWATDYAGHHQDFDAGVRLMEALDRVLAGLLDAWSGRDDMVVITSDHGNMEDMQAKGHTLNPVPGLLIGPQARRQRFAEGLTCLADFAPRILEMIFGSDGEVDLQAKPAKTS